jgi:hypothetical protein
LDGVEAAERAGVAMSSAWVLSSTNLGKIARSRRYENAFVWLDEAMIVNPCLNAEDPIGALEMSSDHSTFKCYMGDTELLVSLAFWDKKYQDNDLYRAFLLDKMNVNEGMLADDGVSLKRIARPNCAVSTRQCLCRTFPKPL